LGKNVLVGNHTGEFQVADAEVSTWVSVGDELGLYGRGKGGAPQ
jgi:hypothetical protein